MTQKNFKIRVLAKNKGGMYAGPFRDTTVGKVYDATLRMPHEYPIQDDSRAAAGGELLFIDDVGDECGAYINVHEGVSYELVKE